MRSREEIGAEMHRQINKVESLPVFSIAQHLLNMTALLSAGQAVQTEILLDIRDLLVELKGKPSSAPAPDASGL